MKTNCMLRTCMLSLIKDNKTDKPLASNTLANYPSSVMTGTIPTCKSTITDIPCSGTCNSYCAVLMLHFIEECCDDPAAFAEDARKLLMKYPLT